MERQLNCHPNTASPRRAAMCPVIPAELVQNAVQQMVYFVTLVGILLGVTLGGRA